MRNVSTPISQMRKLKHREIKLPVQSYIEYLTLEFKLGDIFDIGDMTWV